MLPKKPTGKTSIGNMEVVKMLEQCLESAKLGKTSFAVVVMSDNPYHVVSTHAGDMMMCMSAYWGLDQAKHRLMVTMAERHSLPVNIEGTADSNHFFYNMSKGPACYDFVVWLIIAEMTRRRSGAPSPLKVSFAMGIDSDQEKALHNQYRKIMYDGVIKPALALIGAEEIEPEEGAKAAVLERYTLGPIVEFAKNGEQVPRLTAPQYATDAVAEYVGDKPPITITLRECAYWEHRNSNLTEWFRVAEDLEARGNRVVFIRDTSKVLRDDNGVPIGVEPISGFEVCAAPSWDLHARMALYEQAKCNLFVSNGPMVLGLFGSRPWMMFVELDPLNNYFCETPQFYAQWQGLGPEENFPWSKPTQRMIYKRDTYDNIIEAWNKLEPLLEMRPLLQKDLRKIPEAAE